MTEQSATMTADLENMLNTGLDDIFNQLATFVKQDPRYHAVKLMVNCIVDLGCRQLSTANFLENGSCGDFRPGAWQEKAEGYRSNGELYAVFRNTLPTLTWYRGTVNFSGIPIKLDEETLPVLFEFLCDKEPLDGPKLKQLTVELGIDIRAIIMSAAAQAQA